MKFANPLYRTKKVRHFISDLIRYYNYTSFHDFCFSDKCQFVALLMEAVGRDGDYECIVESKDFDQLVHALKKALTGTRDDDERLLSTIKANAVNYYNESMEAVFNDIYDDETAKEVIYANT